MRNKKYNRGLLIGRFQPFHNGHKYLIDEAMKYISDLIIGIGSIDIINKDNPLSFLQRSEMFDIIQKNEEFNVVKIIGLKDFPGEDDLWLKNVEQKIEEIDVVVSNHDWVTNIFREANYKTLELPFYMRDKHEGTQVRDFIRKNNKEWHKRVPKYLHEYIELNINQNN